MREKEIAVKKEKAAYQPSPFYIAVIVYESSSDAPNDQPLYEETFMLIHASSQENAEQQAAQLVNKPHSYQNQYGQTITWSFKQIVVVQPALNDEFTNGTELFSRFFRNYEAYHSAFLNRANEEDIIESIWNQRKQGEN